MSAEPTEVAIARLQQPLPPSERRRRRWPWIVALVTVVLLLTGTADVYATRHQPLASRGWSTFDGGINTIGDGLDPTTGFVVDAPPGQRGRMTMDIKNDGPFAVTITGVGDGDSTSAQWVQPVDSPPDDRIDPSRLRSFPATIPAGHQLTIMLSILSPANCGVAANTRSSLRVRSRSLGLSHSAQLPLAAPMWFCVPADHHYTPGNGTALIG